MAPNTACSFQSVLGNRQAQQDCEHIHCSVGIMAYNEEANVRRTIHAVLQQQSPLVCVDEVIVIASGCTDQTVPMVTEITRREPRVRLYTQDAREGKASAINLFLKKAMRPVVVLLSADVIPAASALGHLCVHFKNPDVGMAGSRPVPVNDPTTFMGHVVHLIWHLHDSLARVHPKLGEMVAFRNIIPAIPTHSAVDEISIQALISQLGYQLRYEPASVVYNKGPLTIRDFLKQRRRIYAGHLNIRNQQHYQAPTMRIGPIIRQLKARGDVTISTPKQTLWTLGAVLLESCARVQGYYDYRRKREHHIWQTIDSTKDLTG